VAVCLARGRTHPAQYFREDQFFLKNFPGLILVAAFHFLNIALNIDVQRASLAAGGELHPQVVQNAGFHADTAINTLVLINYNIVGKGFQ
jgi:hypothetical protein